MSRFGGPTFSRAGEDWLVAHQPGLREHFGLDGGQFRAESSL